MTKLITTGYLEAAIENAAKNVALFSGLGELKKVNQWNAAMTVLVSLIKKINE